MQRLEVSGAVRHIYIYIYVIRRLKVKDICVLWLQLNGEIQHWTVEQKKNSERIGKLPQFLPLREGSV